MLTLVSIKSFPIGHTYKYLACFQNDNKTIRRKFGRQPYADYTIHGDKKRRNAYIRRHHKDLRTNDPTRAGFLSMFILWNKTTVQASIKDFRKRLKTYNSTNKFPILISGYSPQKTKQKYRN